MSWNYREGNWTEDKQDLFAAYMAQTVDLWRASIEGSLYWLFNGTDESIIALTEIVSDGKLIAGDNMNVPGPSDILQGSASTMKANMARDFFSYAIPAVWTASGHHPFVVDSGYACGRVDPPGIYMTVDTMSKTRGCYEYKLYYLVLPEGEAYKNV